MSKKGVVREAFMNQSTIVSAKFDSQCTYIGESAFKDCILLSEICEIYLILAGKVVSATLPPPSAFTVKSFDTKSEVL